MTIIRLSTKESFKNPDKYDTNMTTIEIPNSINDEIIK